jgi:hypothetical protein
VRDVLRGVSRVESDAVSLAESFLQVDTIHLGGHSIGGNVVAA